MALHSIAGARSYTPHTTAAQEPGKSVNAAMTREKFLAILDTYVAKNIFSQPEINKATASFTSEQKAALLHFNGITANSNADSAKDMMHLFAAFHNKNAEDVATYLNRGVSTGVRLDYGLPLYSENNRSGEDIYVCAVKVMLGGSVSKDLDIADKGTQGYVQNSFEIRNLLKNAPNKEPIQPTPGAIEYILQNSTTYRDSNNNPVIVFIPGVIDVKNTPVTSLIEQALLNGANVNDIGFFDVPGVVWSIIQGDTEAVNLFLNCGADVHLAKADSFGNKSVIPWATATLNAAVDDPVYVARMLTILNQVCAIDKARHNDNNFNNNKPLHYLPTTASASSAPPKVAPSTTTTVRATSVPNTTKVTNPDTGYKSSGWSLERVMYLIIERMGEEYPMPEALCAGVHHKALAAINKNSHNSTAFSEAEMAAMTEALVKNYADPNVRNEFNWTPLHNAVVLNRLEVARVLIANGAKIDAGERFGRTPLHMAAIGGHQEMAELLLSNGAELNVVDNNGQTPEQLAMSLGKGGKPGCIEFAEYLQKRR